MNSKETLKACPFCGGEAVCTKHTRDIDDQYKNYLRTDEWWEIDCTGCDHEIRSEHGISQTIKTWNTRTSTPDTQELIEWVEGQKQNEQEVEVSGEEHPQDRITPIQVDGMHFEYRELEVRTSQERALITSCPYPNPAMHMCDVPTHLTGIQVAMWIRGYIRGYKKGVADVKLYVPDLEREYALREAE